MPGRFNLRKHRLFRRHETVDVIEHQVALDQHIPIVEDQRRHPHKRIVLAYLVGIAKHAPRPMFEGNSVEGQRDTDAADER